MNNSEYGITKVEISPRISEILKGLAGTGQSAILAGHNYHGIARITDHAILDGKETVESLERKLLTRCLHPEEKCTEGKEIFGTFGHCDLSPGYSLLVGMGEQTLQAYLTVKTGLVMG